MIEWLQSLSEALLAIGVILVVSSRALSLACNGLLRRVHGASPESRARLLLIAGVWAPLLTLCCVFFLSTPYLLQHIVPEHCHGEMCVPHSPEVSAHSRFGLTLALFAAATFALFLLAGIASVYRQQARLRTLRRFARSPDQLPCRVIDSPLPLAWCSGLLKTDIFISSALKEALSEEELQVVLAHEKAHVARMDNLKKWLVHAGTQFWGAGARRKLRDAFALACEQAADRAVCSTRGRASVVSALQKVASLHNPLHQGQCTPLPERIACASSAQNSGTWPFALPLMLALFVAGVAATTALYHLAIEHLIALF